MNVFDFAMKMEEDGKAYYENLADQISQPGLKTLFKSLARDEQKHFEIFRQLKEGAAAPDMQDSNVIAEAKNVFQTLPQQGGAFEKTAAILAAYQHAMNLESDSVRLYEDAAGKEEEPSTRELLRKIAAEERKHFEILANIYHFVNAPNEYLAWGEFSNLEEFSQFGRKTD
jgi:rubrerythrin